MPTLSNLIELSQLIPVTVRTAKQFQTRKVKHLKERLLQKLLNG